MRFLCAVPIRSGARPPRWGPEVVTTNECSSPTRATENAIRDRAISATRQAQDEDFDTYVQDREEAESEYLDDIDAEHRAINSERREDAVRSCIVAGNQPDLCELNPDDPYGVSDQP